MGFLKAAAIDQWVDVTAALGKARATLKSGEMLHSPHFTVEQAMTALEIGDPRMDAGAEAKPDVQSMICSGCMRVDLSMAETVQLLECLECKLVQWWKGHTLHQTIYTSLHVLGHERLKEEPILDAAVLLILALVSVSKQIIHDCGVIHVRTAPKNI
jgi:hypothetical protein